MGGGAIHDNPLAGVGGIGLAHAASAEAFPQALGFLQPL